MKICPMCGASYDDASVFCSVDGAALRSLADGNDLIHTVIADRYLITRLLGEGGMGRVYLAKHVRLPQSWAIKVLDPALVRDAGALTRFNQEAASASRIENRHVARVIDFGETGDGLLYLAMEYVDGEPLSKLIEREGALDPARVAEITSQVAEALTAAHELGIVHRDLKPDNIMIGRARDGADDAKVVDFGIAKAIHQDESEKVTKTGFAIGTPEYMSPEQLRAGEVDGRSDLYSLALVTFRMLTGKLPFPADTPQESMFMRVTHPPRTLAEMHPDVEWSPAIQAVIDRALAREPDDRFQSSADFARALRGAVTEWRPPATAPRDDVPLATHPSGMIATATGAAGAADEGRAPAASTATSPAAPPTEPPTVPPTPSPVGAAASARRGRAPAGPGSAPRERDADRPAHVPPRRPPPFRGGLMVVGLVALVGVGGYFVIGRRGGADAPHGARVDTTGAATSVAAIGDTLGSAAPGIVANPPSAPGTGAAITEGDGEQPSTSPPTPSSPPAGNTREATGGSSRTTDDHTRASSVPERDTPSGSTTESRSNGRVGDEAPSQAAQRSQPAQGASVRARLELDGLQRLIEDLSEDDARRVLAAIPGALPRLATKTDTVEAWYYALQANVLLNDIPAACDVIGRIGPDAKTTRFAAPLQIFSDSLRCQ